MSKTFFFYDLETSGLNPRTDRIMQFAGIRTDENFEQIGESYNVLIRLNDDTLPSPDAVVVTGITPQSTQADGLTEAEFTKLLESEIFTPDTVTIGFNNIRFDDEFIRHTFWRNFHDPYEWAWRDGRSRWDLLDVVRMTRALRPEGINWPVDKDGRATNRLELLSTENGLVHTKAHDALSDVEALIGVTKLIKCKQSQLFNYLFEMRDKKQVKQLVNLDNKQPFVYSSGRYDVKFEKTTVAFPLNSAPNGNVLVYDLRHDPGQFVNLSKKELESIIYASYEERKKDNFIAIPVKQLQYNRCPAVAPLGVLQNGEGWKKLNITKEQIEKHKKVLLENPGFAELLREIYEARSEFKSLPDPEAKLYDSFLNDRDRLRIEAVRSASETELADFHPEFQDERLPDLLLHYKARSYPKSLSEDEQVKWEYWRMARINSQLPGYLKSLERLAASGVDTFLLEELQLWAESIAPIDYGN
ncbi:exodeoxyribonuclease I [Candidatus Nomurabacteria bacterium]|nr:exodeoxyribonuclease I [Candidatus Nomurabacteria bacterium]